MSDDFRSVMNALLLLFVLAECAVCGVAGTAQSRQGNDFWAEERLGALLAVRSTDVYHNVLTNAFLAESHSVPVLARLVDNTNHLVAIRAATVLCAMGRYDAAAGVAGRAQEFQKDRGEFALYNMFEISRLACPVLTNDIPRIRELLSHPRTGPFAVARVLVAGGATNATQVLRDYLREGGLFTSRPGASDVKRAIAILRKTRQTHHADAATVANQVLARLALFLKSTTRTYSPLVWNQNQTGALLYFSSPCEGHETIYVLSLKRLPQGWAPVSLLFIGLA